MADAPETLDMEVLCMQMIVDAGSAKSDYMEALQAVKAGDYETAAAKMKSGDEQYAAGHEQHAKLVQQEAAGIGIAMGNGEQCAKDAADWVADAVDASGLAHAFERLGVV